jgi:hypothetical protein
MTLWRSSFARFALVAGCLLVLSFAAYTAVGGDPAVPAVQRGEVLVAGRFALSVDAFESAVAISLPSGDRQANGIYRIVSLTATNLDTVPRSLDPDLFRLVDTQGRGVGPAGVTRRIQSSNVLDVPLAPGESRSVLLVFDTWPDWTAAFVEAGYLGEDIARPGRAPRVAGRLQLR